MEKGCVNGYVLRLKLIFFLLCSDCLFLLCFVVMGNGMDNFVFVRIFNYILECIDINKIWWEKKRV